MDYKILNKEAIVAEYLTGNTSYRKIGIKYGIDFRLVHSWVMKFQGKKRKQSPTKPVIKIAEEEPLSQEVKQLQQELRNAKLHNKLLNAMIDIAEQQLSIDIRKKSGTKQ